MNAFALDSTSDSVVRLIEEPSVKSSESVTMIQVEVLLISLT